VWKARKSEEGQDIRVSNPRPPDSRIFWGPWSKDYHKMNYSLIWTLDTLSEVQKLFRSLIMMIMMIKINTDINDNEK